MQSDSMRRCLIIDAARIPVRLAFGKFLIGWCNNSFMTFIVVIFNIRAVFELFESNPPFYLPYIPY